MKNKLPAPRLELLWNKQDGIRTCTYSLVIPLQKSDLRRENSKGKDVRNTYKLKIGKTKVDGGVSVQDGIVATPYRDGCHALWDSHALKLPIYAVCGETFTQVPSWIPYKSGKRN
jgi:hypothetical protein